MVPETGYLYVRATTEGAAAIRAGDTVTCQTFQADALMFEGSGATVSQNRVIGYPIVVINTLDSVVQVGDIVSVAKSLQGDWSTVNSRPMRLFRFVLKGSLSSGTANADILLMNGTDTTVDDIVRDPLAIFDLLETGDPGLCLRQDGLYWVIQAPCPDSGSGSE